MYECVRACVCSEKQKHTIVLGDENQFDICFVVIDDE